MTATLGLDPFREEQEHPLLPLPSHEQVARIMAEGGQDKLQEMIEWRRKQIHKATEDPLYHELEPPDWADARALIAERIRALIILGGNRSGKSRLCGKAVVETIVKHRGVILLCIAEDENASRETQQKIVWHYLPARIKTLRGRRDREGIYYVNWSEANGFSERKLVLPNRSKILFGTYGERPEDYEGMMFGHPTEWAIQWWGDENLRLNWLNMLSRRGQFQPGTGVWSYTPIHGMTPCIKEAVGSARTVESRPSVLLPDRVNVPGLPKGHMPYIQIPALPNARVIYFFSENSPFGPGPNGSGERFYEGVARDCAGKPDEYTQRVAYGYTRDVVGRRFPKYTREVHQVKHGRLPWRRTNYVFLDPHGDRNWAILWVGVTPGNPPRYFIYRDWPDRPTYGEWAVPTERATTQDSSKGWDGDLGPAQQSQGWGVLRYKQLMLRLETIDQTLGSDGTWADADLYRCHVLNGAYEAAGLVPRSSWTVPESGMRECVWALEDVTQFQTLHPEPVREEIRLRLGDPRAVATAAASTEGGITLVTMFAREDRHPGTGELEAPRMLLMGAYTGKGIDDGCNHVNELLDFKENEPVVPLLNEPRLYLSERCEQVDWALHNYTGKGGEKGACKEWADLCRYLAQSEELRFVEESGTLKAGGFVEGPV